VRKPFGAQVVLDGIDQTVPEGTVLALLGPNGAGKTTTVQILSTLIPADSGHLQSPATTWPPLHARLACPGR
jgi:ABC-2 type transport system ATP-binding protein